MKDEEIIAGNKLIAEFMGAMRHYNGFEDGKTIVLKFPDGKKFTLENLKYHSDWNWLMPVLEKIENMGYETQIFKTPKISRWCCDIVLKENENGKHDIATSLSPYSKILSVWFAVTQFIEWRNHKYGKNE